MAQQCGLESIFLSISKPVIDFTKKMDPCTGTGRINRRIRLSMAANRFPRKKTSPIPKQRKRACRATFARIPFNLACKVRNDRLMFNLGSTMRRETTGLQRSPSAPGNPGLRASATRRTS